MLFPPTKAPACQTLHPLRLPQSRKSKGKKKSGDWEGGGFPYLSLDLESSPPGGVLVLGDRQRPSCADLKPVLPHPLSWMRTERRAPPPVKGPRLLRKGPASRERASSWLITLVQNSPPSSLLFPLFHDQNLTESGVVRGIKFCLGSQKAEGQPCVKNQKARREAGLRKRCSPFLFTQQEDETRLP